jgi:TusA-related sulfurtransferase
MTRLNLRGVQCPFVLAEIIQALAENPRDGVEVECDDARSVHQTVPAFCRVSGYQFEVEDPWGPVFRICIRPSAA